MNRDLLHIICSPEKLESDDHPGSDVTNTKMDYELLDAWGRKRRFLSQHRGISWYVDNFDNCVYLAFLSGIFSSQLTLWYYTGHGLDKAKASKLHYSSSPNLGDLMKRFVDDRDRYYHLLSKPYVLTERCKKRKVKGGELSLNKFGFCDLYGLLKFWFAGIDDLLNLHRNFEPQRPTLKHLVIIVDSCYGGEFAQQLPEFVKDFKQSYPFLSNDINITIQAACGPDERTVGGYFTPVFTYLNDPDNEMLLETLKMDWKDMTEEDRRKYGLLDLPSPIIVTTLPAPQGTTMEIPLVDNYGENPKVTLFQDAGFFKFCFVKVHQHQDKTLFEGQDRALGKNSADQFMNDGQFQVFDYKLKTMRGPDNPYAGNPLGLFLLEDPCDKDKVICVHIHFDRDDTSHYTRINLVHHKKPPLESTCLLHVEDHDDLTKTDIKRGRHKIKVSSHTNAPQLVEACRQFVHANEEGRWEDVGRWNMENDDISVRGRFRLTQERSASEDAYLKYIEQFNLPKVTDE